MPEISEILLDGPGLNEIREGLPFDEYCQIVAMNPSTLVKGVKSLKHLRHGWYNRGEDSDDLLWGRAVHCLLFEPEQFEQRYCYYYGRRDKRVKEYQEFLAEHQGCEVLSRYQYDSALEAARSFVDDPHVQPLIESGKAEVSLLCADQGLQCKGRLDWITTGCGYIVDLKTTRSIEAKSFGRDFYKFHYDIKLGLYRRWLRQLTNCQSTQVKIVCVEKEPPYDVTVLPVVEAVLDHGEAKGLDLLSDVRSAIVNDVWPGVAGGDEYWLEVPYGEMDVELEGAEEYADG